MQQISLQLRKYLVVLCTGLILLISNDNLCTQQSTDEGFVISENTLEHGKNPAI